MTMNLGDVNVGVTVNFKFTTVDDTGLPATLAGTPAISVYKDNSVTQSTAGVTLTADFDGLTGLNHVAINLSADGTFYAAASEFDVVITTGTVDSVSVVGYVVAHFSVQNRVVDIARWLGTAVATPTVAGVPEVDITHINGAATNGNNATLSLAQLNIVNSGGSAIVASSTGGNGHGIAASGNGSGEGVSSTGGATGHGFEAIGGATSGNGLQATATAGTGNGVAATGGAGGHGIHALGGVSSGNGILAQAQGSPGGEGFRAQAAAGPGASFVGGSGNNGIQTTGNGGGAGFRATGGATGHGISAVGGATSGNAINASATAGNGHGLNVAGQGSGHGLNATGGATGNGIDANGGATSGNGIDAAAATSGDGMQLVGAGGGLDLDAAVNEFTQAGMAQFFTTDSGQTYGTSVAGSVVKETADNAGGSGLTAQQVRDSMKLAPTAGAPAAGSVDAELDAILDLTGTTGVVISTTTQNSIADAILRRDWTAVAAPAARSLMNAARAIRNRVRINAGTMTVFQEDDLATAWSAPVTTDAAALPIVEIDPT